jgi:hypothetical protein
LAQGGITNSVVIQKLGKLCNDFRESDCLEVIPSLQAVMAENLLWYAYRGYVDLLRLSRSSEEGNVLSGFPQYLMNAMLGAASAVAVVSGHRAGMRFTIECYILSECLGFA